jgi:ABC-2 type transport system ATP-binding protein
MIANILEVKNLSKSYPNFSLRNINFSLLENCITGFIGINGAGKTTTIKAILNLIATNSGTITLLGKDIKNHNTLIKDKIGVVLGDGYFYESLTINEMSSIIKASYSHWDSDNYTKIMKEFCLDPRQKISTLSKGMRMKFSLLLALSHNAEFLIMDEPTSGLDPEIRSHLLLILQQFMQEGGRGVFFSTHIISDIEKIADQVILIDSGKIIFDESKDDLLYKYCSVRGGASLYDKMASLPFLDIEVSEFGFSGIIRLEDMKNVQMQDLIIEKASLENIMLAHLNRRTNNGY